MKRNGWQAWFGGIALVSLAGCITNATIELTKAPFDATSDLTNATSNAIGEFTQPTTDITSSNKRQGAAYNDAIARARKRTEFFAAQSQENLRTDIARGRGEYLVSLASLAGVPSDQLPEFELHMKNSYAVMFDEPDAQPETTVRVVEAAWSKGYGRTR